MEISLNTTDEAKIEITEVHDMGASQQQWKRTSRNWLMRKLYIGGSFAFHSNVLHAFTSKLPYHRRRHLLSFKFQTP